MPHPTPILQDELCVKLKISKTIGKTNKNTKEVNAKTIKNHWENQRNQNKQNFWTYDPLRRHRSKSFVFFGFFGFPNGFWWFRHWPLWLFWFFWFSQWLLIFSTGFTGKPVRRRICLYIFSLLHPLSNEELAHKPMRCKSICILNSSSLCLPLCRTYVMLYVVLLATCHNIPQHTMLCNNSTCHDITKLTLP